MVALKGFLCACQHVRTPHEIIDNNVILFLLLLTVSIILRYHVGQVNVQVPTTILPLMGHTNALCMSAH